MKSVKPGRGPSMMNGIGGIFMIGFGILWTVIAARSSMIFALFGVFWTGMAVVNTVYNFKNATGENRYSAFDITDGGEESAPLNEHFGMQQNTEPSQNAAENKFCPYCGVGVDGDFEYCNSCGRKLP